MAEKLTKRSLDALRRWAIANPDQEREVGDTEVRGFYARARRGRVEFFFREGKGRRTRRRLGEFGPLTLDDARVDARELYRDLRRGKSLAASRREAKQRSSTLADVAEDYLADLQDRAERGAKRGRRSSHAAFERLLTKHVLPRLGSLPIIEIDLEIVTNLHRSLHETPVEANRMLTTLSAVMGHAERQGLRAALSNPCLGVLRFEEIGRRRDLTPAELKKLGGALRDAEADGSVHPSVLLAIRLVALTGLRRSEVLGHESKKRRGDREGLRWGDLDLEGGTVRLRDSKTGTQTRVLGRAAIELLTAARPEGAGEDEPVCPGSRSGEPFVGINRPRVKIFEAAELSGVDLHSLRHSFASIGAQIQNGRYATFVAPLLGHGYQKRSITERYIHSNPEALRPAADAIAEAIARHLGLGKPGQVIAFRP